MRQLLSGQRQGLIRVVTAVARKYMRILCFEFGEVLMAGSIGTIVQSHGVCEAGFVLSSIFGG